LLDWRLGNSGGAHIFDSRERRESAIVADGLEPIPREHIYELGA
jgi:hypothetical protein